jgi:hypothetical protein
MSLKGIMSVSGQSGLYKVVSQTKSGFIVESMTDHKKTVVQSTQKISMLNDISIYTTKEDMPLNEVLLKIKEASGDNLPVNSKSEPKELKNYFKTILPDYDEERVYASDIKKIVSWYPLVKDILTKEEEPTEKASEDEIADEKAGVEPSSEDKGYKE